MIKRIVIGSRASALALAQSVWVKDCLKRLLPDYSIEIETMNTEGDRRLDRELAELGGKGLFTYELEEKLRAGEIDLAVHSLKDMPQKMPEDLPVLALSAREDPRDALICRDTVSVNEIKVFGTSSPRRKLQIKKLYDDCSCVMMRGNVNTRLKKLSDGGCDAIILAAAGLKRLGLEECVTKYFSPDEMIPAAGQGILAIQGRIKEHDAELTKAIAELNNVDSCDAYAAESAFLQTLEADCTSPVGAYSRVENDEIELLAVIEGKAGEPLRDKISGSRSQAKSLAISLAEKLLTLRG